jgi:hypothetical protein
MRTYVRYRPPMRYEVDVTIAKPLDDTTRGFLDAVQLSANPVIRFKGDSRSITLTVDVAGQCREDAIRAASSEVARIFPAREDRRFGEPRET